MKSLYRSFSHLALAAAALLAISPPAAARSSGGFTLTDGTEVEVRIFEATGDTLVLGFACDEGASVHEEETAEKLAGDGVEVWMPDLLGAFWLPKLPSSIAEIPAQAVLDLARSAHKATGKDIYLMAGGPDVELVLRALARIEQEPGDPVHVKGAVILFPRLLAGEPDPGKEPEYVDAVGTTRTPILVLEGERTPNRWGLPHLVDALGRGGSPVQSLVVPDVRGYFYKREDASSPEEVVTSQMHGLIKASLFKLRNDT